MQTHFSPRPRDAGPENPPRRGHLHASTLFLPDDACVHLPRLGPRWVHLHHNRCPRRHVHHRVLYQLRSGAIAGDYTDAAGVLHGFLLSAGNVTSFDFPGSVSTNPWGINDAGQIVGIYRDAAGVSHGFLLSGGNFTSIDVPHATITYPRGINSHGDTWENTAMPPV